MSQSDFGTINPATKSGSELATDLNAWRTAVHSQHKGAVAPTYRVAGMSWVDDASTPWLDKVYDGTDWIVRGSINSTTNAFTPYIAGVAIGDSSTSAKGLIEQATKAEGLAMSSAILAVTPDVLSAFCKQGSTLTAANTLSVGSGNGGLFEVDGSTDVHAISDAGGPANGRPLVLRFIHASPGLLRHNFGGTERVMTPSGVDIDLKQNDIVELRRLGGNWHVTNYLPYARLVINDNKFPRGFRFGCLMQLAGGDPTNDVDIAPGSWKDKLNTVDIDLGSALIKRIDAAWAVGTNQGGMDTGSVADGWYHVHLIKRLDTGVVDAVFSLSFASPTMPANYTAVRRIGSVLRASGALVDFMQVGRHFLWKTPRFDVNIGTLSTTSQDFTLSVPPGDFMLADINVILPETAVQVIYFRTPGQTDLGPDMSTGYFLTRSATAGAANSNPLGHVLILTGVVSHISARSSTSSTAVDVSTNGWFDPLGEEY